MLINVLPNPAVSFSAERPRLQNNLIIHVRSTTKYHYPRHPSPYMFIANLNGQGQYDVNCQKLSLTGKSFLFLRANDALSISYNNDHVESLFILFEDQFFYDAYRAFSAAEGALLEYPFRPITEQNSLGSIPLAMNEKISSLFDSIIHPGSDQRQADEKLMYLIREIALLESYRDRDIGKIRAVRKATRVELYRRLYIGREFMESNLSKARLDLDEIAKFANLNKFHFIYNFKQLFGETPHQYIVGIKLKKAHDLVVSGNYSITEVCQLCGFESLPSFSNLFKKRFGVSPSMLRSAAQA